MTIDAICLKEAVHLAFRHPKYWIVVAGAAVNRVLHPKRGKVFNASYFFCRHADDFLDGDRKIKGNPEEYVLKIVEGMKERTSDSPKILDLYHYAIEELDKLKERRDDPEQAFARVIHGHSLFDYDRSKQPTLLSLEELGRYYRDSFEPVLDISMIIAGSRFRGADLLELVHSTGHLYSIRDMKTDLSRNIINIPRDEIAKSRIASVDRGITAEQVMDDSHLCRWMYNEVANYMGIVTTFEKDVVSSMEPIAKKVCIPWIKAMQRFGKRYLEQNESYLELNPHTVDLVD